MARASVLIVGSGPDAIRCADLDLRGFDEVVAINNAWRVAPWTVSIYPDDFPEDRRPKDVSGRRTVRPDAYVPSQNRYGGVVYAGGTMAFTTAYWVLDALSPGLVAYLGCDMVYPKTGKSHFYGRGTADPLRQDPTLQSLEAKARRLQAIAALQGCAVANLSTGPSRLPFPRATVQTVSDVRPVLPDGEAFAQAREAEAQAGIHVPSGRYWEHGDRIDPGTLSDIDALWLASYEEAAVA
ncbi:MAG: hypothetical protein AAFX00_10025 [Pseudomonadota bacterium]